MPNKLGNYIFKLLFAMKIKESRCEHSETIPGKAKLKRQYDRAKMKKQSVISIRLIAEG